MATVAITEFLNEAEVTGNKTLAEGDSGVVQRVTATAVITLPSTVAGRQYIVLVDADDITVSLSPAAADKIMGNGFTSADNKDAICTNGAAGRAFITLVGDGADGWNVARSNGTWTREA